jgi:hypothetical protein
VGGAFELGSHPLNIEASLTRKFQQDLAASDIAPLGKESATDAQIELEKRCFALLGSTPSSLEGGQRRGRPVVTLERFELGEWLLDGS